MTAALGIEVVFDVDASPAMAALEQARAAWEAAGCPGPWADQLTLATETERVESGRVAHDGVGSTAGAGRFPRSVSAVEVEA